MIGKPFSDFHFKVFSKRKLNLSIYSLFLYDLLKQLNNIIFILIERLSLSLSLSLWLSENRCQFIGRSCLYTFRSTRCRTTGSAPNDAHSVRQFTLAKKPRKSRLPFLSPARCRREILFAGSMKYYCASCYIGRHMPVAGRKNRATRKRLDGDTQARTHTRAVDTWERRAGTEGPDPRKNSLSSDELSGRHRIH